MSVKDFLAQAKANAITKGKEMAKIELSVWDSNHEAQLKQFHGFTDTTLAKRKSKLTNR